MGWSGPSKDEVWQQLSQEMGAEFVDEGFRKGSKVRAHVGPWIVTLDMGISDRDGESPVTRLRAPYINPDGFQFTIYRKGIFSALGKLVGMQDESKVVSLFSDTRIRQTIQAQPQIRLRVKRSEGWLGPLFPENVYELHFEVVGVIKNVKRLKSLFNLFAAVLDQLCQIGSAYKQKPRVTL
jgi:hypothetical protein